MYDMDTDQVCMKLTYLTDVTSTVTTAFRHSFEERTTYPQRGEDLETDMACAVVSVGWSNMDDVLDYEVTPYDHKESSASPNPGTAFVHTEEKGYTLSMTGRREAMDSVIEELADFGYGLPEKNAFIADWRHPVQSFKGHRHATATIERLGESYKQNVVSTFEMRDGVHHTDKEVTYEQI